MRSVATSLDSLSSPSPSPSPPPQPQSSNTERALSQPTTAGAGLDSGSELSELTEEEQENENRSQDDDDDAEEEDDDDNAASSSNTRRRPVRRGGGRRKRGGIVPAPMWDWAYKSKKPIGPVNGERGTTQPEEEEEEEEEMAGPPKAMEEEEDEEEEEDSRHNSMHPSLGENGIEDEDDQDDDHPVAGPVDPTSLASINDDLQRALGKRFPPRNADSRIVQRQLIASQSQHPEDSEDDVDDNENEEEQDEDADIEEEDGDVPQLHLDAAGAEAANDTDAESDIDADVPDTAGLPSATTMDMEVDVTAPPAADVAPLAAAAAASSIMAGSSILASATPTPDSSLSPGTSASSRSASPAPGKADEDEDEEDEEEEEEDVEADTSKRVREDEDLDADIDPEGVLAPATSTAIDAQSKMSLSAQNVEVETEDVEVEGASVLHDDPDLEIDAELQPAHRAEALDVLATIELKFAMLRERVYVEKMEGLAWEEALVANGTHPEMVYLQTELSRREAKRKDLAARQRTYDISCVTKKRKMDEDYIWSWWKFTRDELQTDMVSEHKRKYRRLERDRRALGQPQPVRHIPTVPREVPPPPTLRKIVKSFPYPGNRVNSKKRDQMSIAAGSLSPMVYPELSTLASTDIASDLEFLYQNRRAPFDSHGHRMGMSMTISGPQLGPGGPAMTSIQPQPPHGGYDPYAMNVDSAGYAPGNRMPPPLVPAQYQQPFPTGSGRPQHHQSHPQASSHGHSQGQFPVEPEMTLVTVGPGIQGQYYNGPGQSSQNPMHPLGMSRPISPVHVVGSGPGVPPPGAGKQWPGDARMAGGHFSGGKHDYGWMGMPEGPDDARDREREIKREREREREREKLRERSDREREREREQRELLERQRDHDREYMLQQQQQQQQQHRHAASHQHPHPPAPSSHHHQAPHHHHRHHHHVVHHHHPQQSVGSSQSVPPLAVPPNPSGPGSITSPRVGGPRDYSSSSSRPQSGPGHPPEILSLSASKPGGTPSHWKSDELTASEYREIRGRHGSRPSSTHPAPGMYDERERPLATPFAMASSQAMSSASSGPPNGQPSSSVHSPRLPWTDDHGSRMPPSASSYSGTLGRGSPLGLSPPRSRPPAPRSPSTSIGFPGPMRSPTRYAQSGPPPSTEPLAMHSLSSTHGPSISTPSSPGLKGRRPLSPPPTKLGMSGSSMYSPPRLSGPGRTSTPTTLGPPVDIHNNVHAAVGQNTSAFSRTASPLMAFNSPSHGSQSGASRQPNGSSNILPAPKINAVQMVDGP